MSSVASCKESRVRFRRWVWAGGVVAGAALVGFLVFRQSGGPVYEGRSVADWLELYQGGSPHEKEDALEAFRALGDRAVPFLFSVVAQPDRSDRPTFTRLRGRLPRALQWLVPATFGATEQSAARELLTVTRPSAQCLLPRLRPWLSGPEHPRYSQALNLLATVGAGVSEGVPFLIQGLRSSNRLDRTVAAYSLARLDIASELAVPALIEALAEPGARHPALKALGRTGSNAAAAVPAIEALLQTPDLPAAAGALQRIQPNGKGLDLLIAAVGDTSLRSAAAVALGDLGPTAAPAVAVLLEALRSDESDWTTIADALLKISPGNPAAISILEARLEKAGSAGPTTPGGWMNRTLDRLNLASNLLRFAPGHAKSIAVLRDILRTEAQPIPREFAADVLREAGPAARAAIPELETALQDENERVRRSAASALRKIRASEAAKP